MDNSSLPSAASKVIQTNNEDHEELVTITEKSKPDKEPI
jgi:hypothetical protein